MNEKYSVGEFERRFLLADRPTGVTNPRHIVDLYVDQTRLRLRSVEQAEARPEHKLGHKRRLSADDPTAIMHTSLYLDEAEFAVLAELPGRRLVKTRWSVDLDGRSGAVDVFEETLEGLIMLEVDLADPKLFDEFVAPSWAGPEITRVEAFTGGQLAGRSYDQLTTAIQRAFASQDLTG